MPAAVRWAAESRPRARRGHLRRPRRPRRPWLTSAQPRAQTPARRRPQTGPPRLRKAPPALRTRRRPSLRRRGRRKRATAPAQAEKRPSRCQQPPETCAEAPAEAAAARRSVRSGNTGRAQKQGPRQQANMRYRELVNAPPRRLYRRRRRRRRRALLTWHAAPWKDAEAARAGYTREAEQRLRHSALCATHQRGARGRCRRGCGGELVLHVHGAHERLDGRGVPAARKGESKCGSGAVAARQGGYADGQGTHSASGSLPVKAGM
jgi:hypothetical protein